MRGCLPATHARRERRSTPEREATCSAGASGYPAPVPEPRVAIIGAGVAGLACAGQLHAAGVPVVLFDKARKQGGRVSTRRAPAARFDHGAQYFTAKTPEFAAELERWVAAGHAAPWSGRIVSLAGDAPAPERERYVGIPGMSGIATALAEGLEIRAGVRVTALRRDAQGWILATEAGEALAGFTGVIVAVPAGQAEPLLREVAPALAERAAAAVMQPCVAAMLVAPQPLPLEFDGAFVHGSILSWVARNSSKPGREGPEAWVLHGSPRWSAEVLDDPPAAHGPTMLAAFCEAAGVERFEPVHLDVHRWRYANATGALADGFLHAPQLGLGACGDWCRGARIEDAWWSGRLLAAAWRDQET